MICKKCKRKIYADCMLIGKPDVEGICVFCHYNIHSWDSNGQLVKEKDALNYRCDYCNRIVPNQSWWIKGGCKWCKK